MSQQEGDQDSVHNTHWPVALVGWTAFHRDEVMCSLGLLLGPILVRGSEPGTRSGRSIVAGAALRVAVASGGTVGVGCTDDRRTVGSQLH